MAALVDTAKTSIRLDPKSYAASQIIDTQAIKISPEEWTKSLQVKKFVKEEEVKVEKIKYQAYKKNVMTRIKTIRVVKAE